MLTFQSEHFNACTFFLNVGKVLGLINRDGCFILLGVDLGELLFQPFQLSLCFGHVGLECLNLGANRRRSETYGLASTGDFSLTSAQQWKI